MYKRRERERERERKTEISCVPRVGKGKKMV